MWLGFLIGLGAAAGMGIFVIDQQSCHRKFMKKLEKEKQNYLNKLEYNKAHLPFAELPGLSIDPEKFEEVVKRSSGLALRDDGDSYACLVVYAFDHYERHSIPKAELDGDTIKLIELITHDVDWFYTHHTGNSAGECGTVLESFLLEKYPMLTEESVSRIVSRYCINDR